MTNYENPNKIKMLRKWRQKRAQEIYKKIKTEWLFGNMKQKYKGNRIQHNWTKKNKNRSKIARNIT